MKINSIDDLFRHVLSDTYNAEKQLTKALPKMAKGATEPALQEAFQMHLQETEEQIQKLDQVFEMCGMTHERITCEAMKGLVEEADEAISEIEKGPLLDVALIVGAQKVEHYEIAAYGSLCALAKKMGNKDAEKLLHEILEQERSTDEKLTKLAETCVNDEAMKKAA